jgi:hypothetical protein
MKRLGKIVFAAFVFFHPVSLFSQNWMMAQQYASAALDSVLESKEDDAIYFMDCDYARFKYNADNQMYSLYLTDYFQDSTFTSLINVSLHGGVARFTNDLFDAFEVSLPDWSDYVFIWNGTGKKISFALSCDDSEFSTYTLDLNNLSRYHCTSEFVYIKISTVVDGTETGQIHYKLIKGKGYKVQYDTATAKFEVFSDDRLN